MRDSPQRVPKAREEMDEDSISMDEPPKVDDVF